MDLKPVATSEKNFVTLPLLTVAETARYLGVGRRIVYQLLEQEQIRAVKVGGSLRIEQESLDRFRSSGILP